MSTADSEKPLLLYTGSSPNGYKASITLEELKAAYGAPEYELFPMDISTNIQKEDWYIKKANPNGRIPALVDRTNNNFSVFESAAIELYVVEKFDKEFKFSFDQEKEPDLYSEMLQWIFFAHGGVGPMQGQAFHFIYRDEKIPYAIERYQNETKRLFGVLEIRLKDRDYLAGSGRGKYTIADINVFPWVRIAKWAQITEELEEWPNLKRWHDTIAKRPAVEIGVNSPPSGWNKK